MTSDTSPSPSSGAETEAVAQAAPAPALRFNSLVDIQAAHLDLLKTSRAKAPDDRRAAILQFVETARNSGALLDTFEDRVAAQDILDYWGSSLYADASLRGQYGDADDAVNTALEPFDEHAVDDVARAAQDAVQRSLGPGERDIAMRMLMRLMRLERGGRFHPVAVSKAELLSAVGEPAKVRHVLQVLTEAGVLRAVKDGEYVALSHESLSRKWDELHQLLRRRAEFRDAASFWKTAGQDRAALIRGKLLDEARRYHDLDQTERAFIDASSVKETEAVRVYRATAAILLVLAVAAAIGWIVAVLNLRTATKATADISLKSKELAVANDNLKREKAATAERMKLRNVALLVHALAEVATASTKEEFGVARIKWDALNKTLQDEKDFDELLKQGNAAIDALEKDGVLFNPLEPVNAASLSALELGYGSRDSAAEFGDENIDAALRWMREITFETTRRYARDIVKTFDTGTFRQAEPLVREFRVLYWSDMTLVESSAVTHAMIQFESQLRAIHRKMNRFTDEQNAWLKTLAESMPAFKNPADLKRREIYAQLREAQREATPEQQQTISRLLSSLTKQPVDRADVNALRILLKDTLEPALDEELAQPRVTRRSATQQAL